MTAADRIEAEWLALLRPAMHCYTPEHIAALLYVAWVDVDAARKETPMTDYKPGTVAKATVRGQEDVLVVRANERSWLSAAAVEGLRVHSASAQVTDVRPLILLDLEDPAHTIKALRESARHSVALCGFSYDITLPELADQIEAQTKPPRIPEPGLWGVVEATTNATPMMRRWVRYGTTWRDAFGGHADWDDLIDPTLVREGVES